MIFQTLQQRRLNPSLRRSRDKDRFMKSTEWSRMRFFGSDRKAAVTMLEIMVVIALVGFLYSVVAPQFSLRTGAEAATKVQRLADDIRSAFDLAALNNKTYRMSFVFSTGEYSLDYADRDVPELGDGKGGRDPSAAEAKAKSDAFEEETKQYLDLAGDPIKDDDGKVILGSNDSPIIKNRTAAKGPVWTHVDGLEWQNRTLGPYLMISDMQAEHHLEKQALADVGQAGGAYLYFFPSGYVEKAYIAIYFKKDEMEVDESQKPYTIITNSFLGTASVNAGVVEVDVHAVKEES
jgi:general secretion pathway protein H